MPTTKTLVCEIREAGDHYQDGSLSEGANYRVLCDGDQIIESTSSPVVATAEALARRGHAPTTLFALRDWHSDTTHCVLAVERVRGGGLWGYR